MSILKIRKLMEELETEYSALTNNLSEELKKAQDSMDDVKRAEKRAIEKLELIAKRDEEVSIKEKEANKKLKKITNLEEAEAIRNNGFEALEQAKKMMKEAEELMNQVKVREEDIATRELKLSKKQAEYKDKVKEQILSKFVGNLE